MLEDKHEAIALLTGVESSKKNYYTELKKTVDQLKKKNMQLEIMNELMQSFKIDMSLDETLKNMLDKLREIIRFDQISFFLLKGNSLVLTNIVPEKSYSIKVGTVLPIEGSLYWQVINNRQVILKRLQKDEDYFIEKNYFTDKYLQTILVLPIYSKNKRIGVLSIGRCNNTEWSFDDLAFLENLTDHLAVSIENVQLYREVFHSKQEWEDTFKAVDDMIFILDKDMNIMQYNDAVNTFKKNYENFHYLLLEREFKVLANNTYSFQKTGYKEINLSNQSTYELSTYPLNNNDQIIYGVIVYIKDVTEKRKMEAQLIHAGKLAAIGEMAAGVAHELNSPLTAILGNSQLLLRSSDKEDSAFTLLQDIKNCGDRCKQIIKSLLTFSRQDEYVFSTCSVNDAIKEVLNLLKYQFKEKNIDIITSLVVDLPDIEANQQQIEQIIINLILNAKDALESCVFENKEIYIETSLHIEEIHISVRDNGIGIEENRLTEIFHPFHTTKEFGKGTGLGLSVSIGIAKAHGGTIHVESQVNKGSIFTLVLPIQQDKNVEVSK
ncbi:GAF domain-containing protein [Metabacillus litoralis]|uniref:histidine kinase n=1 Tax=Metabacillus litoralis TaxID=152268 RepID=A0A5C6W6I1_9BACI|nr:sensor histidine kinase [Metabacillus litoralis]TXC93004.1 GAF domain-containing protein [Metabacillus litoralis]